MLASTSLGSHLARSLPEEARHGSVPPPRDALDLSLQVLWRLRPRDLLRFGTGDAKLELVEVLSHQVLALRRTVDTAALVRGAHGIYLAHLEFETSPSAKELADRQYVYAALLYARHRHRYPVRSTVILVEDRLPDLVPEFRMQYGPECWGTFGFRLLRLRDLPPEQFLADPASAALVSFSARSNLQHVQQAAELIQAKSSQPDLPELLATLYVVAGRRFPAEVLRPLLRSPAAMYSSTYNEIFNEGKVEGLEQGLEKGETTALLAVLSARKLKLTPEQRALIRKCRSAPQLLRWIRLAVTVRKADELFASPHARKRH